MQDKKTKTKLTRSRNATIVIANDNDIVTVRSEEVQKLDESTRLQRMPNIRIAKLPITKLTVSVVQPICQEMGLEDLVGKVEEPQDRLPKSRAV